MSMAQTGAVAEMHLEYSLVGWIKLVKDDIRLYTHHLVSGQDCILVENP